MTVLAIDQGTSGTKAIVVDGDGDGQILAVAETSVRPSYLPGGSVEQNPEALLSSVLDAGQRAIALVGQPLEAVAIANQGETVLAWDPTTGLPLSQAIVWQDRRAEPLCAALTDHGEWIAERTGLVLDPYFSAPKMAWLRQNVTTAGVVTTTDTWLVHHLTGEFVTDASTAGRSLLLDLDKVDWDPELLELFKLGGEVLPRIVACDETIGITSAFGAEARVAGLVVDQSAALLAEGCLEPGTAKCTFGTGAFLLANSGPTAVRSTSGLTTSIAWRARDRPRTASMGRYIPQRPRSGGSRIWDSSTRPPTSIGSLLSTPRECCACPRWPASPRPGGDRMRPPRSPDLPCPADRNISYSRCCRGSQRRSRNSPPSSRPTSVKR
jgi:glycerol kinase